MDDAQKKKYLMIGGLVAAVLVGGYLLSGPSVEEKKKEEQKKITAGKRKKAPVEPTKNTTTNVIQKPVEKKKPAAAVVPVVVKKPEPEPTPVVVVKKPEEKKKEEPKKEEEKKPIEVEDEPVVVEKPKPAAAPQNLDEGILKYQGECVPINTQVFETKVDEKPAKPAHVEKPKPAALEPLTKKEPKPAAEVGCKVELKDGRTGKLTIMNEDLVGVLLDDEFEIDDENDCHQPDTDERIILVVPEEIKNLDEIDLPVINEKSKGISLLDQQSLDYESLGVDRSYFSSTKEVKPKAEAVAVQTPPKKVVAEPKTGVLKITNVRGKDLVNKDKVGAGQPYFVFKCGKQTFKTSRSTGANPKFTERFNINVRDPDAVLELTGMEWDRFTAHDVIGYASIPVADFRSSKRKTSHQFDLTKKGKKGSQGKFLFDLVWEADRV